MFFSSSTNSFKNSSCACNEDFLCLGFASGLGFGSSSSSSPTYGSSSGSSSVCSSGSSSDSTSCFSTSSSSDFLLKIIFF